MKQFSCGKVLACAAEGEAKQINKGKTGRDYRFPLKSLRDKPHKNFVYPVSLLQFKVLAVVLEKVVVQYNGNLYKQ